MAPITAFSCSGTSRALQQKSPTITYHVAPARGCKNVLKMLILNFFNIYMYSQYQCVESVNDGFVAGNERQCRLLVYALRFHRQFPSVRIKQGDKAGRPTWYAMWALDLGLWTGFRVAIIVCVPESPGVLVFLLFILFYDFVKRIIY